MRTVLADPVVDWETLGKVIAAALIAGIGVTAAFSIAVLGATRSVEMRRSSRGLEASAFAVLAVIGGVLCIAAIVGSIVVMAEK